MRCKWIVAVVLVLGLCAWRAQDVEFWNESGATWGTAKITNTDDAITVTAPGGTNVSGALSVGGAATVTGNLAVDTDTFFVDQSEGKVGIGTATPASLLDMQQAGGIASIRINTYSATNSHYPGIDMYKSDTNTAGEAAQTDSGDFLGYWIMRGTNSSLTRGFGAQIYAVQSGVAGASTIPTKLYLSAASASATFVNQVVLSDDGNVGIGTATPAEVLDVVGNVKASGALEVGGAATVTGDLAVDTNVLVVDSGNNRVGIGTATPTDSLDVRHATGLATVNIQSDAVNSRARVRMRTASSTSWHAGFFDGGRYRGTLAEPAATEDDDRLFYLNSAGADSNAVHRQAALLIFQQDGVAAAGYVNAKITFHTANNSASPAERMVIKSDGSIFMPDVYGDDIAGSTYRDLLIKNDGQLGYDSSSIDYKENVVDVPTTDVDKIRALQPRKYDRKDGSVTGEIGLIAEEVAAVYPDAVSYRQDVTEVLVRDAVTTQTLKVVAADDGTTSTQLVEEEVAPAEYERVFTVTDQPETVIKSKLIVPILAVVQEQQATIEALTASLAALEARVAKLEDAAVAK